MRSGLGSGELAFSPQTCPPPHAGVGDHEVVEGGAPRSEPMPPVGVHSEHDLKEQSDAQIIVSRFPFRGGGSKGAKGGSGQYSRRGLPLRGRGAYGIHRAFGPRCQGLYRRVASLRSGERPRWACSREAAGIEDRDRGSGAACGGRWWAPPPLPKGKHVTGFSGRCAPLQIQFLCHPASGGTTTRFQHSATFDSTKKHREAPFCPLNRGKSGAAG